MARTASANVHPLVAAAIAELPAAAPFTGAQRAAWLDLMVRVFDVAYGVAEDMPAFLSSASKSPATPVAIAAPAPADVPMRLEEHAGHDFFIGADGGVRNAAGAPVLIGDVPAGEVIFDCRPVLGDFRDRDGIVWADGFRGLDGIAPGISFCGPG